MRWLLFALISLLFASTQAQTPSTGRSFAVLSYNVENLFDTLHDAGKDDFAFLPDGANRWTSSRLYRKMDALSKVIAASGVGDEPPLLVGLCEVENDTVMSWFTRRSALRSIGYRYVMTHSADPRGIDVALLYNPLRFRLYGSEAIRVPSEQHSFPPTRDILHAWGMVSSGDTLDVMVVHLPSRAGGTTQSNRHRMLAARRLRTAVDSLLAERHSPHLIVMGDFNAEPDDRIFRRCILDGDALHTLLPTSRRLLWQQAGTYRYKGRWQYLDHIMVSSALLDSVDGKCFVSPQAEAIAFPYLLEDDATHRGQKPFRTYLGPAYHGGISDHLPLRAVLHIRD